MNFNLHCMLKLGRSIPRRPGYRSRITEVGETTEYYVEIDEDYIELVEELSIGKITTYTANTYRDLSEEKSEKAMDLEHG